MHLGLTGARLGAADCLFAGIGSRYVPAEHLTELERELAVADLSLDAFGAVNAVLDRFATDPGPPALAALFETINHCYGQDRLDGVLEALGREPGEWGRAQLKALATKSPTSLAVTFRQLRQGAALEFDDAMRLEYRLVHRIVPGHDFREGVRALIIDKDRRPDWRPGRLEDVAARDIEACFAPLPGGELRLDPCADKH
jgi:enoyl-CoA hydratase